MVGTGSQFLAIRGLETRTRPGTGADIATMSGSAGTRREGAVRTRRLRRPAVSAGLSAIREPDERLRLACSRGPACRLSTTRSSCPVCTIKPDSPFPTNDLTHGGAPEHPHC